uniref:Uncharacterized protein n=1 Tax=Oryza glumipatula TaxID=40148 RepID=A0A0E0B480_9ORYZ
MGEVEKEWPHQRVWTGMWIGWPLEASTLRADLPFLWLLETHKCYNNGITSYVSKEKPVEQLQISLADGRKSEINRTVTNLTGVVFHNPLQDLACADLFAIGCGEETGMAVTHTQSMDWPDLAEVIIITSSIAIDYTMEDRMVVAMEKAFLSPDLAP